MELAVISSSLSKFWDAAQHMLDTLIARLPALIVAVIVFVLFYFLSLIVARIIRRVVPERRQNLAIVFSRLTAGLTILVGLLVAFSIVSPSFQAADLIKILGIGGVAIGFAFQNILQNFLAGLLLLWAEPFRVGDEIKLDAFEGTVEEVQTRATIIKTYDERQVVIPNADLFTRPVIVNTAFGARRCEYDLDVSSTEKLNEVKSRITKAVQSAPGVLPDPAPEVRVVNVDSGSVKLKILWSTKTTRQHDMLASYDQVLTAIAESLNAPAKEGPRAA